jgi:hypothetical protein
MAFGDFTVVRASNKRVTGSSGSSVTYANNVPAFQFNDNGTYRGTSVELGATNQIRNNSMVGAVAGTPGTLPTNWSESTRGLTREVVSIGTELGVGYIDLRYSGTPTSTGGLVVITETSTATTASTGQAWTGSVFLKKIAESAPPDLYRLNVTENTSIGGFVKSNNLTVIPTSSLVRYSQPLTLSGGATVGRVQFAFGVGLTFGQSYDFTIRIGWPQMELGLVDTSPIVTAGSTASRAKDDITLTGASSLIGQTQGAICAGFQVTNAGTSRIIYTVFEDASNFIRLRLTTTNTLIAEVTQGGTPQASIESSALTTNTRYGAVLSYDNNSVFLSLDGAQVGSTDTSATIPTCSKANVGSDDAGANQLNGTIAPAVNYATALSLSQANDLSLQLKNL